MTAAPDPALPAPRDAVAHAVRADILAGRLAPGDRLRETDLAERFGVSRIPVREALSQLQNEGFVTLVRYRGATVSVPSGTAARELVQVRRGLEVLAAQLAARRRGGEVAAELARVVELGRDLSHSAAARAELPPLVLRFHELVAEASGNSQLRQLLEQLLGRVSWLFGRHLDARSEESWSDHAAIARAILSGSPVQAGFLMDEHIAKDEALLDELDN
ncbi:GntR family transcriptional regulator [Nocardia asteroides]|uniref:GntR family transcriptional regulator n=1 Tax=Nocardia asteroides TaxID=1824 RepID=UPI001E50E40E|nr:GntR family transcriptional regulator [Nocardia asteroides]UGT62109.1 GntR family transcriptional regulator [Nocardia asteroides]